MKIRRNTEPLVEKIDQGLKKETLGARGVEQLWSLIEAANRRHDRFNRIQLWAAISSGIAACVAVVALSIWQPQPGAEALPVDYVAMLNVETTTVASSDIELVLAGGQRVSVPGKYAEVDHLTSGLITVNGENIESVEAGAAQEPGFNRIVTPYGKRSLVTLPDGTAMWVNSNTRVIYPVAFTGERREIFVEGEVFLDVERNEKLPFIVKTRKMDVRVLGTRFNVQTDAPGERSEVVLVDGKVEVDTGQGDENIILYPSQLLSYDATAGRRAIHSIDPYDYVAWKDGYYQFHQQSMDYILTRITKFYGVAMEWDENVRRLTCSGKLDLKDDPAGVLETLKRAAPIGVRTEAGIMKIYVKK